jgi:intein/homing endonuclease
MVAASSPDGIRGFSPNLLYLDEFAFLRPGMADEFMASVMPTISSGKTTRIIITSCVVKDTMVFTPDGIRTVGDFIIDDGRVLGYEVPEYQVLGRYGMNRGHIMHNDGDAKETRIVRTRYSEVETSLMHKFWTCRNGEYKIRRAHELQVGDYVMVKYGMNCWGNDRIDLDDSNDNRLKHHIGKLEYITPDWAYFFGLYIAEGNARYSPGNLSYIDITCGDDLSDTFNHLGLKYQCYDGLHYRINAKTVVSLLMHVGFDIYRHAPQKIIPPRLMRLSRECTAAMIQGMFDGDGSAPHGRRRVTYVSTSERLIDQLRMLLINFGILSSKYEHISKPTKRVKVTSKSWVIEIAQAPMVDKFLCNIGFRFVRKQQSANSQPRRKERASCYDYIPFAAPEIRRLKKEKVLTNNEFKLTGGICDKHDIHLNRKLILEIKSKLPEDIWAKYDVFKNAEPDAVWTPITSIDSGFNKVYDFSLNDDNYGGKEWSHSVVHNALVCSQTPNGLNHFYRMWEDGVDEDKATPHELQAKYVRSVVLWNEVPGREPQWGIDEEARIGEQRFRQEYMCEFVGSATTLIDYKCLEHLHPDKPLPVPGVPKQYSLRLFDIPLPKQMLEKEDWTYVAALDTGFGMRQDYHVLQILLAKSSIRAEQVLVLSSNEVTVEDFCSMAASILKLYGNPPLTIEYNGGSGMTAHKTMFEKLGYDNLINYDQYFRGIYSTNPIKTTAVMLLKLYVQRGYLKLKDETTINELMSFTKLNQFTWGGAGGNHDDHVTSLYWAVYFMESNWFPGKHEDIQFLDALEITFAGGALGEQMKTALITGADPVAIKEQKALADLEARQPHGAMAPLPSATPV